LVGDSSADLPLQETFELRNTIMSDKAEPPPPAVVSSPALDAADLQRCSIGRGRPQGQRAPQHTGDTLSG
jgi:hypothetical protein